MIARQFPAENSSYHAEQEMGDMAAPDDGIGPDNALDDVAGPRATQTITARTCHSRELSARVISQTSSCRRALMTLCVA